jgi:hypothetical protein
VEACIIISMASLTFNCPVLHFGKGRPNIKLEFDLGDGTAGTIIVAAVSLLTATISSGVLAQGVNSTSGNATTTSPNQVSNLPNITGIPLRSTISGALSSKVKTSLSDAIGIAQKAVGTNTSATLAFIRPLNGYLIYDVHVRNNSNNTVLLL